MKNADGPPLQGNTLAANSSGPSKGALGRDLTVVGAGGVGGRLSKEGLGLPPQGPFSFLSSPLVRAVPGTLTGDPSWTPGMNWTCRAFLWMKAANPFLTPGASLPGAQESSFQMGFLGAHGAWVREVQGAVGDLRSLPAGQAQPSSVLHVGVVRASVGWGALGGSFPRNPSLPFHRLRAHVVRAGVSVCGVKQWIGACVDVGGPFSGDVPAGSWGKEPAHSSHVNVWSRVSRLHTPWEQVRNTVSGHPTHRVRACILTRLRGRGGVLCYPGSAGRQPGPGHPTCPHPTADHTSPTRCWYLWGPAGATLVLG